MAGRALGVCLQLKGCADDQTVQNYPDAGGTMNETYSDWQLAWWTVFDWLYSTMWQSVASWTNGLAMEHYLCYGSHRSSGICSNSMGSGGYEDDLVASSIPQRFCFEKRSMADAGEIQNHQASPMVCMVVSEK